MDHHRIAASGLGKVAVPSPKSYQNSHANVYYFIRDHDDYRVNYIFRKQYPSRWRSATLSAF